nr:PEP-CTERM system histidine kinase PrsK [Nitrospirota bacterium]
MDSHLLLIAPAFLSLALSLALAGLVLARFERTTVHWAFAATMTALGLSQAGTGLSLLADSPESLLWWRRFSLVGEILLPVSGLVFSLTFARSNAHAVCREWRGGLGAAGLLTAAFLALIGSDGMFALAVARDSDLAYIALGPYGVVYACLFLVAQVLILANLEQTLRHADETTRWSLKFPVFGLGLLCVFFIYQKADLLLFRTWHPGLAWLSGAVSVVACLLIGFGFLRRPLRDVQIYVSRRVLSDSLTFLIVGGLLVVTGLVAGLIRYSGIPGQVSLSTLFIFMALLGLAFALSAHNVRLAFGRFVERHFFPHQYDYRTRWMEVTQAIGSPGTPEQIAERVLQVLRGLWGPQMISIWTVADTARDAWARIGVYTSRRVEGIADRLEGNGDVKAWLEARTGPVDFTVSSRDDRPPPALVAALRPTDPVLLIPLKAGPQAIGWMALGAGAGEAGYGQQDRDLLRCIAAQVADRLQHLLLSDRLAEGRELQAFYEYSTFFLHDLKNFTSTLSLVTQNAEKRGGDPAFQRAAMDTVRATVLKMTALIGKLTALSRDPQPKRVSLDLNGLVRDVLKGFDQAAGARLVCDARPVPPVEADPEQLQQVLLNLVLNAREAVNPGGAITVRTEAEGDTVRLVVEDDGCGMDRATMAKLFRPFRTAKGRGLGIGLYQCRKIVEAHLGALKVESEQGKGSRFVVCLPVLHEENTEERIKAHG